MNDQPAPHLAAEAAPSDLFPLPDQPFVFICHASEDKGYVRLLARDLERRGISIWVDEEEVGLGDCLPERISHSLASCAVAVGIISPVFLAKRWPRRELFALIYVELTLGVKRVLPVRHGLTVEALAKRDPLVASLKSVSSASGLDAVVHAIVEAVGESGDLPDLDTTLTQRLTEIALSPRGPTAVVADRDWRGMPRCRRCGGQLPDGDRQAACEDCGLVSSVAS